MANMTQPNNIKLMKLLKCNSRKLTTLKTRNPAFQILADAHLNGNEVATKTLKAYNNQHGYFLRDEVIAIAGGLNGAE